MPHYDAGTVAGCAVSADALKEIFIIRFVLHRRDAAPRSKPVHKKATVTGCFVRKGSGATRCSVGCFRREQNLAGGGEQNLDVEEQGPLINVH